MRVKHKNKRGHLSRWRNWADPVKLALFLGLRICPCGTPIIPEYHTKRLGFVVKEDHHKCKECRDEND